MDAESTRHAPQNLDAERSILGAILLHDEALEVASEVVTADHFYRDAHRRIFKHMLAMHQDRVAIEPVTLRDLLQRHGELETIGGAAYLASLVDGVPRSANIVHYARIVREHADRRAVISVATKALQEAYDTESEADAVVERAEQRLFQIAQGDREGGLVQLSTIMPRVLEQIEAWHQTKHGISGLASGFDDLDGLTRGFQPGNLIIVAARPAMGKSSFVLNIAQHAAHRGLPVAFFSLEMSLDELAVRSLTAEAHVDGYRLQRGWIHEAEWARISTAVGRLSDLPLYIDESPFVTVLDIRSRARRLKAQHGLALLVIDYTQLMVGHERRETRTLELATITRTLKAIAKDLSIPVIALSQLNRDLERRDNKRPVLADLRDSGALEQDADLVLFIYRDEVYHPDTTQSGVAEIIVAKQRNGPIGTVKLGWKREETRFVNLLDEAIPEDQRLPIGDR